MKTRVLTTLALLVPLLCLGCPTSSPSGEAAEDVAPDAARPDGFAEIRGELPEPAVDVSEDAEPLLPGCCDPDHTCPPDSICVNEDHKLGGVCKEVAPEGECWRNADCPAGWTCLGALVCPCGADCDQEDQMGACVQYTCNGHEECRIATNWVQCCVCPEAVTVAEMDSEPCMFEGTEPPEPFPFNCDHDCDGDEWCAECPAPLGVECKDHQCAFTGLR
jgi:hypothetical protein